MGADALFPAHCSLFTEKLVAGYAGKALLRDLSFVVAGPAFVAILGHNGSGKTALFRVLTGQLPYQGRAQVLGREASARPNAKASAALAYLPQRGAIEFGISVRELALMGRYRHHGLFILMIVNVKVNGSITVN